MSEYAATFLDGTGTARLEGTLEFTDPDNQPVGPGSSPDVPTGDSAPILIKTGDTPDGASGTLTLETGAAGTGDGGNIVIQPGAGSDGNGAVRINAGSGADAIQIAPGGQIIVGAGGGDVDIGAGGGDVNVAAFNSLLSFYDTAPAVAQPTVPATPLPQDIVDALVALGLVSQSA